MQGQELHCPQELRSASAGRIRLGFFCLPNTRACYIGIWSNDKRAQLEDLVWVANRDAPIIYGSGNLTIDDYGNMTITNNRGPPFVLYSGHVAKNISAVLLDTGNFVLREMSSGRQLWQSFDHPSHVLLPGMKLGVNRKTGQKWFLTSWRGEDMPKLGNFTFGLHPSLTNRLVILLNGDIYWTSGYLNSSSPRLTNSIYSFDYISNENETYFNCSVDTGKIIWPQLTIDYLGVLPDNNGTLVNCTSASAYLNEGCVAQLPVYRSPNDTFSSLIIEGLKFNEGENLTLKDCEAKCLKNGSCVAYASTNEENQTICEIWSKGGLF